MRLSKAHKIAMRESGLDKLVKLWYDKYDNKKRGK